MNGKDIEIIELPGEGYLPLHDFKEWRVAALTFCDDLKIENVKTLQQHLYTDEIFVLLKGSFSLFTAGDGDAPGTITRTDLEPCKLYNVRRGVWHNHIMDEGGAVVIVENSDTTDDNSPIVRLNPEQLNELLAAAKA